jgi:hypothetical protein
MCLINRRKVKFQFGKCSLNQSPMNKKIIFFTERLGQGTNTRKLKLISNRINHYSIILLRVWSSVNNNKNGFRIGWLNLLTPLLQSLLITINLQQLTINLQLSTWLPGTRSISRSSPTTDCSYNCQLTWNSASYSLTETARHVSRMRAYWSVN